MGGHVTEIGLVLSNQPSFHFDRDASFADVHDGGVSAAVLQHFRIGDVGVILPGAFVIDLFDAAIFVHVGGHDPTEARAGGAEQLGDGAGAADAGEFDAKVVFFGRL